MADTPAEQTPKFEFDEALEADIRKSLDLNDEPEQETPAPAPETQTPEQTPPNDQQTETPAEPIIEIDGEKIPLADVKKWRTGHLLMDDYTRKTQQVAEERRQLEEERKRLAPFQEIEKVFGRSPQVRGLVEQSLQQARKQHPEAFLPPMQPLASAVSPATEQELNAQLDRDLKLLRYEANAERQQLGLAPLSDDEWGQVSNQVMKTALDHNVLDLTLAYRLSGAKDEWSRAAIEASKKAAAEQAQAQARQSAGSVMSGSPRAAAPAPNAKPKDLTEGTRKAYQELVASGTHLFVND